MSAKNLLISEVKDVPKPDRKPRLDIETFQHLLQAAYVLQEHNDSLHSAEQAEAQATATIVSAAADSVHARPPAGVEGHGSPAAKKSNVVEITTGTQVGVGQAQGGNASSSDATSQALAEIVATQHQIQTSHLEFQEAIELICERAQRIVHADGALIGMLSESRLVYSAGSGNAMRLVGHVVPADACLTTECLTNGATLHSPDVESDYLLDAALCGKLGIRSLIAVPIYYEGSVVGSLQLHFEQVDAFQEPDIRSCQLLAGLVTEAKARSEEKQWKQALAAERETMLQALEALKPQLEKLATDTSVPSPPKNQEPELLPAVPTQFQRQSQASAPSICTVCSNEIEPAQLFCGVCGSEKSGHSAHVDQTDADSLIADLGRLNESEHGDVLPSVPAALPDLSAKEEIARELPMETLAELEKSIAATYPDLTFPEPRPAQPEKELVPNIVSQNTTQPASPPTVAPDSSTWQSASKAKAWLDTLRANEIAVANFWNTKRADLYLGIALLLVATAVAWMLRSGPATASSNALGRPPVVTAKKKQAPQPSQLSLSEQLLVDLGLADPPQAPADNGNPDLKVWVDLQTALYYCPGADLYGRTSKGKYTSQRDAQMDQFEPAARKACD